MRISVIGCGYLGAVHAAAMAKLGHDVVGIDVDAAKVEALVAGRPPFFEPGLPELLDEVTPTGRLRFTTDIAAVQGQTCTSCAWARRRSVVSSRPTCATSRTR